MKYCIVTILDSISETSMPLNEFVFYRDKHYNNIKQYVIVCDSFQPSSISIPSGIPVIFVNSSKKKLREEIKRIISICQANNEKIIVHLHQLRSALLFFRSQRFISRKFKTLFTVHSVYGLRDKKYKMASTLLAILSSKTVCVSKSSYNSYSPIAKLIKGKNVIAIQNGVDTDRIDSIEHFDSNHDIKTLVYVGRIIPIKNQKLLVNQFSKFHKCKMVFIGAEGDNKEVSNLIASMHFEENITITGLIPRDEVFKMLFDSDIYISSSTVEGLPVSVLEAMYAGLPTILSNIPPHLELQSEIKEVGIYDLSDEKTLVEIVNEYLDMNSSQLREIGLKSKEGVKKFFSLERMHKQYDSVYNELLKGKK